MDGPPLYETNQSNIRLGSFWQTGQQVQASCPCGHVGIVPTGMLVRKYGAECYLADERLAQIARSIRCKECGRRGPGLRIVTAA